MILKIVLGRGGRGLLNYISQLSKAPTHRPQNAPQIYDRLHQPNLDRHPSGRSKPAARINQLPHLHQLNVVRQGGYNAADPDRQPARSKSNRELLLQGHAHADLDGRAATDAAGLRRPSHWPGTTSVEKGARRRIKKAAAPPTFSTFAGTTPRQIAAEFGALRKLKPNVSKAVAHLILSPGPEDRVLSKDEWKRVLEVALAEHGATDTPHAAYLHDDTHHQHLHVFFSRVTPAGDVISDSHSFQKNRSASKKIAKELQLTPLPTTPSPTASADRTALENAARGAERRGDALPRAEVVRTALQQSKSRAEYSANLRAAGIETDFPTRGARSEIFGSSMRVIGSYTWVKSSTIAKDLSWPKIKSRFPIEDWFAEVEFTKLNQVAQSGETTQEAPPAQASRSNARIDQDRMPPIARAILAPTPVKVGPLDQTEGETETGLAGVSTRLERLSMELQGSSALIKTGLLVAQLGVLSLQLSWAAIRAFWAFIERLLRAFGIALRPKNAEVITPSAPPQLASVVALPTASPVVEPALEPYFIQPAGNQNLDEEVSQLLGQVLDSVESGKLCKLPVVGDGTERAALVAALEDEASAGSAGGAANASSEAPSTPQTNLPALPALFEAVKLHQSAHSKMMAERRVDTPEVARARANLADAEEKLDQRLRLHAKRLKNVFTRPITPVFAEFAGGSINLVAVAEKALEAATEKFPPVISPPVQQSLDSAKKNVLDTAKAVLKEFRVAVQSLDSHYKKQVNDAEITLESHIDYFSKFSVLGNSSELRDVATNSQKALAKALADQDAARAAELAQREFDEYVPLPKDAGAAAIAAAKAAEKPRG